MTLTEKRHATYKNTVAHVNACLDVSRRSPVSKETLCPLAACHSKAWVRCQLCVLLMMMRHLKLFSLSTHPHQRQKTQINLPQKFAILLRGVLMFGVYNIDSEGLVFFCETRLFDHGINDRRNLAFFALYGFVHGCEEGVKLWFINRIKRRTDRSSRQSSI